MLYAFGLSFVRWDLIRPNPRFVGLDNYLAVLTSPEFWQALWVTVVYTVGTVPPAMAIGLGLALLLDRHIPGRAAFRAICFVRRSRRWWRWRSSGPGSFIRTSAC